VNCDGPPRRTVAENAKSLPIAFRSKKRGPAQNAGGTEGKSSAEGEDQVHGGLHSHRFLFRR